MRKSYLGDILIGCGLLLFGYFFLSPLEGGGFLTDDFHNVRFATYGPEGKASFDPDDPSEVLTYFHSKATDRFELYRPLVPLSFRLSFELSGINPKLYIQLNILLHLLGTALAMKLARTLFPDLGRLQMILVGALFLFSPLQTQVAYWSSARSDSLCWIFGAMALIVKWKHRSRCLLPVFLAVLSMLSKESGLFFLGLVAFCDLLPGRVEGEVTKKRRAINFSTAIVALGAYVAVRAYVFGDTLGSNAYGSQNFADILRDHGLDNLLTGLKTAIAPATEVVIPRDGMRIALKSLLGMGTISALVLGIFFLAKSGFPRFFLASTLLTGPFVLANLVSRLDERFINTRGCYVPMFAVALLGAIVAQRSKRWGLSISLMILLPSMFVSWHLQDLYVKAAQGTEKILMELRKPMTEEEAKVYNKAVILDFQHMAWFQGGFSAAGCLQPATMRPFLDHDIHTRLVLQDTIDPTKEFLTPFPQVFTQADDTLVLDMRFIDPEAGYRFNLLHPRPGTGGGAFSIEALSPGDQATLVIDPNVPTTLVPTFVIKHGGSLADQYRICLFNPRGRVVDTIAKIESKAQIEEDAWQVTLTLPALSPEMSHEYASPKYLSWSVYAEDSDGTVRGQSGQTLYLIKAKTP